MCGTYTCGPQKKTACAPCASGDTKATVATSGTYLKITAQVKVADEAAAAALADLSSTDSFADNFKRNMATKFKLKFPRKTFGNFKPKRPTNFKLSTHSKPFATPDLYLKIANSRGHDSKPAAKTVAEAKAGATVAAKKAKRAVKKAKRAAKKAAKKAADAKADNGDEKISVGCKTCFEDNWAKCKDCVKCHMAKKSQDECQPVCYAKHGAPATCPCHTQCEDEKKLTGGDGNDGNDGKAPFTKL